MSDHCAELTALLVRAADGSASAQELAQLDTHLATCDACAASLAEQRAVHAWLDAQPVTGASLGFDARVMAAVRAETAGGVRGWLDSLDFRRWTFRLVPVAAALALAAVAVSRTDATGQVETPDTEVSATVTDAQPVSSALWSDSISGSSLLTLMLTASADDTLAAHRKDP
jgi:anti-sigma factor RsiW